MSHLPKNHRLRPLYRFLAFLAGLYCIIFGAVGVATTGSAGAFSQGSYWAVGLKTNLAFSILSIVVGVIVVAVTLIGRNLDRNVLMVLGPGFILMGVAMMAIMQTSANVLNFGMSTCVVSFIIGTVLFAGALYGETSDPRLAVVEEHQRTHAPDPERHGVHP